MDRTRRLGRVWGFASALLACWCAVAAAQIGSRPRNLALHQDEVLATSMGGNSLSIVRGNGTVEWLPLGAASWGLCAVGADDYVVTHPHAGYLSVVHRAPDGTYSTVQRSVPYYCTEVITSPNAGRVLVANRGQAPVTATESWQHAVYEVDWSTGAITRTFVTEREPRALAVSPDGSRLIVGHVQGAVGAAGLVPDYVFPGRPSFIYDGGSIVVFSMATGAPLLRFPVGSPVRGLAVWPPPDAPPGAGPGLEGYYRVFFTHAGDGAHSEDPNFGGRRIPNVISSIEFDDQNQPTERTDAVFGHQPDLEDAQALPVVDANLPAVVPEKLAIRWHEIGPGDFRWQLWVTNAASGTVSRARLDQLTGHIEASGTLDITNSSFGGSNFQVIVSRTHGQGITSSDVALASASNATVNFDIVQNPLHVNVDIESHRTDPTLAFSANPQGIVFDPVADRMLVVTQADHQLVSIPAETVTGRTHTALLKPGDPDPLLPEERNFFTFGRGFDFRETPGGALKVQTQACITCHVDGHLDGKVRHTVRLGAGIGNRRIGQPTISQAVTVPSVFDVGLTEWIFFEGTRTIRDGVAGSPGCDTQYCDDNDIFPDTDGFTNAVSTPLSAYAASQALASRQLWGRYFFQKMNCSRCHGGQAADGSVSFLRTVVFQGTVQPQGPLPAGFPQPSRVLHDVSQSFVSEFENGVSPFQIFGDGASLRNMTDVGTRGHEPAGSAIVPGVNTPALAGAWDNAPYFHDGRYRTLEEVLENTWLDSGDANRAAPLFTRSGGAIADPPDNATNVLDLSNAVDADLPLPGTGLYTFLTHAPGTVPPAPGRVTAKSWLDLQTTGVGATGTEAVLDFLRAVSSQTELCPPLAVSNFGSITTCAWVSTVTWNTTIPISCKVRWRQLPSGPWSAPFTTAEGTSHSFQVAVQQAKTYQAEVTLESGQSPKANMPPCNRVDVVLKNWGTKYCLDPPGKLAAVSDGPLALSAAGNPARGTLLLEIAGGPAAPVDLRVYDARGRLVRTLLSNIPVAAGTSVTWDGRSDAGEKTGAGVYFVVLQSGESRTVQRVTMLR